VCGNGVCENGENQTTCPSDCSGGGPGCGTKECGFDDQGNSCGTCPQGFYCSWEGKCESEEPCTPDCSGKQCGDDGCGEACGTCPVGLICTETGQCASPYADDDVTSGQDGECYPDCTTKACGPDGCGGNCGVCPESSGCNPLGMCEEGYVPSPDDGTPSIDDKYACPEGQTLMYGKCVALKEEGGDDSAGCSAGPRSAGCLPLLMLLLLLLMVPRAVVPAKPGDRD